MKAFGAIMRSGPTCRDRVCLTAFAPRLFLCFLCFLCLFAPFLFALPWLLAAIASVATIAVASRFSRVRASAGASVDARLVLVFAVSIAGCMQVNVAGRCSLCSSRAQEEVEGQECGLQEEGRSASLVT
jgi:hypothetical protein